MKQTRYLATAIAVALLNGAYAQDPQPPPTPQPPPGSQPTPPPPTPVAPQPPPAPSPERGAPSAPQLLPPTPGGDQRPNPPGPLPPAPRGRDGEHPRLLPPAGPDGGRREDRHGEGKSRRNDGLHFPPDGPERNRVITPGEIEYRESPNPRGLEWRAPEGPHTVLGVVTGNVPDELATQVGLPDGFGLLVREVVPDSPAAKAGLQKYDVLKMINDQLLTNPEQLAKLVIFYGKDAEVTLTMVRKGKEEKLTAKLAEQDLRAENEGDRPWNGRNEGFQPHIWYKPLPENADRDLLGIARRAQEEAERARSQAESQADEARASVEAQLERAKGELEKEQERLKQQLQDIESKLRPPGVDDAPGDGADASGPKTSFSVSTTTTDGNKARLVLRDASGELEVIGKNDSRVLTVRDPKGNVVYTSPLDTEEQRKAVPEKYRKKLEHLKFTKSVNPDGSSSVSVEAKADSNAAPNP